MVFRGKGDSRDSHTRMVCLTALGPSVEGQGQPKITSQKELQAHSNLPAGSAGAQCLPNSEGNQQARNPLVQSLKVSHLKQRGG